jgi:hypothetical protein
MRFRVLASSTVLVGAAGCGETPGDVVPKSASSDPVVTRSRGTDDVTRPSRYPGDVERCAAFDRSSLRGQRLETAKTDARASGCDIRQSVVDGEPQILTADLVPYRIDVETKHDIVVAVGDLSESRSTNHRRAGRTS